LRPAIVVRRHGLSAPSERKQSRAGGTCEQRKSDDAVVTRMIDEVLDADFIP
jgi:hypothetical protein